MNTFANHLHVDIETFSSVSLGDAGIHAYVKSPDFEILIVAYSIGGAPVKSFSPGIGEAYPDEFIDALNDPDIENWAHNAPFERACFNEVGFYTEATSWRCTMIKAYYCGLPGSLAALSAILKLGDAGKDKKGKGLIKFFCIPIRPYKKNNYRRRNHPQHDPEGWSAFENYCRQDVVAEMALYKKLERYELPTEEWAAWALDQRINDAGMLLDLELAERALALRAAQKEVLLSQMKEITGSNKPNSPNELKKWLSVRLGRPINSIAKDQLSPILEGCDDQDVLDAMDLRSRLGKTSISKFRAMLATACPDFFARGFLQFYGAYRTGRWAGRRIQPQNLPRNYLSDMEGAIEDVKTLSYDEFVDKYPDLNDTLSQLIRAALIAPEGFALAIADYSAIEARVLAYLANEEWRLEVFRTHGKIYEASASVAFGVPIEEITKDSPLRQQGKVRELACGYQGSVGAMRQMDFDNVLDEDDEVVREGVTQWRKDSPNIVAFWRMLEDTAKAAVRRPGVTLSCKNGGPVPIKMHKDENALWVELPSGRRLSYWGAHLAPGKYGDQVRYFGMDERNQWVPIDTYGGKLTENIVQAYARDLLSEAMLRADAQGHDIRFHVHDEIATLAPLHSASLDLTALEMLMSIPPWWAGGALPGLPAAPPIPLNAEGFITTFYRK